MTRTIILPREILDKLREFTSFDAESNGILLYRREGDVCPIEAVYVTGVGSAGHVASEPLRMNVVNEFLRKNPKFGFVKFHTHTVGTVAKFGADYAREFSSLDIEACKLAFVDNPEYIAMLITPETELLYGMDNPQLRIVDHSEIYELKHKIIERSLRQIAAELGVERERFEGIRK